MKVLETDIAVIGAGPAGVCAALSAARRGRKTVLVTNRPVLGGNSSSEIRVWTRGAVGGGNLYGEEMGVWGELKMTNLYRNPDANPIFWDETLLDLVLNQQGLTLLLNTEITQVEAQQDRVLWVEGDQQATETRWRIQANVFIDATGDSTIGAKAGVPYYVGNDLYDPKREDTGDHHVLCSSILFYTRKEDHPVPFVAPEFAYSMDYVESLANHGGRILSETMGGSDCWWFEYGGSLNTIENAQDIAFELKRMVLGVWNYIKNSGKFDAECSTLEWIGSVPGKRESRRMQTAYLLSSEDIQQEKTFSDGAFYGGWYLDMHPSGGMHEKEKENCVQIPVHLYQVPLRCLYSTKMKNLLFAGRNIGMEREAFASSRVMNTCALAGQASAELAAMMEEKNCPPWELDAQDLKTIQLRLNREDMFLPGTVVEDTEDLVQQAKIEASSWESGMIPERVGTAPLREGGFVMFPAVGGKTVSIEVEVKTATILKGSISYHALPNCRLASSEATEAWQLEPGRQQLQIQIPQEENRFGLAAFLPNADVELVLAKQTRVGFVCGIKNDPAFYEPAAAYETDEGFYDPEQVKNQVGRPWNRPNLWQAAEQDPAPWITARLAAPTEVRQIRLVLDPDLSRELPSSRARQWQKSHKFAARQGMPAHLIREMRIETQDEVGQWKEAAFLQDNYKRLVVAELSGEKVRAIRLTPTKTWGEAPAIYGIHIYEIPV